MVEGHRCTESTGTVTAGNVSTFDEKLIFCMLSQILNCITASPQL